MTLFGFVLALVLIFVTKEYTDLMRPIARRVVLLAAWLQGSSRARYRAEWLAELAEVHRSSDRSGLPFSIGVLFSATRTRPTAFWDWLCDYEGFFTNVGSRLERKKVLPFWDLRMGCTPYAAATVGVWLSIETASSWITAAVLSALWVFVIFGATYVLAVAAGCIARRVIRSVDGTI